MFFFFKFIPRVVFMMRSKDSLHKYNLNNFTTTFYQHLLMMFHIMKFFRENGSAHSQETYFPAAGKTQPGDFIASDA